MKEKSLTPIEAIERAAAVGSRAAWTHFHKGEHSDFGFADAVEKAIMQISPDDESVLERFRGLLEALDPEYPDDVTIRCEVTAADLRALARALGVSSVNANTPGAAPQIAAKQGVAPSGPATNGNAVGYCDELHRKTEEARQSATVAYRAGVLFLWLVPLWLVGWMIYLAVNGE